MNENNRIRCAVMGGGSLTAHCLRRLQEKTQDTALELAWIATADPTIQAWADQHQVASYPAPEAADDPLTLLEAESGREGAECSEALAVDYLIWLEERLPLPEQLAALGHLGVLCYHNAPADQAATPYAPSLALMAQAERFGIAWLARANAPQLAPVVLHEASFAIDSTETALSLTLKGYDAAIASFPAVLDQLLPAQSLPFGPQNSQNSQLAEQRSAGTPAVPTALTGILRWEQSALALDAQVRACNFGPQAANSLALPKLLLRGPTAESGLHIFAIGQFERLSWSKDQAPGTIVDLGLDGILVATSTEVVQLKQFVAMDGSPIATDTLVDWSGLRVGDQLPPLSLTLATVLDRQDSDVAHRERHWVKRLQAFSPLTLKDIGLDCDARDAQATAESNTVALEQQLNPPLPDCLSPQSPLTHRMWKLPEAIVARSCQQPDFLPLAFVAFLARLSGLCEFDIAWQDDGIIAIHRRSLGSHSGHLPCHFCLDLTQPVDQVVDGLQAQLDQTRRLGPYRVGVPLRYPSLRARLARGDRFDLPIRLGRGQDCLSFTGNPKTQLSLVFTPDGEAGLWRYDAQQLTAQALDLLQERFEQFVLVLAQALTEERTLPLTHLAPMGPTELHHLLHGRNETTRTWPLDRTVPQLFEAQAAQTPEAIALVDGDQQLTYGQLNHRANQLAHQLKAQGIGAEDLVGICLDRSFELFISLLAILKAGAAYLPLDPQYPSDRLALIIEDAAPALLLAQQKHEERLPASAIPRLWLEQEATAIALRSPDNLPAQAAPHHLAYVIYTSGSTGKPKGVMIEHGSLTNFCFAAQASYGIGGGDRVLQFSTINFDLSVEQIYPYLISGGSLALRSPAMTESIPQFLACCEAWQVTVLDLPTAYWNLLMAEMISGNYALPTCIRRAIIIGEPANPEQVAQWQRHVGKQAQLINAYGPTEATVAATQYWVPLQPPAVPPAVPITAQGDGFPSFRQNHTALPAPGLPSSVPVGQPMGNMQIYLLDSHGQPVVDGAIGEICIGGLGVARGYLNRPELTAERFIVDPWWSAPDCGYGPPGRIYRTGDLGRYRADGLLDCLGRIDNQVKLRGYRIELGEIETCLLQHPAVKQAIALVREDQPGQRRLVAYWVTQPGRSVSVAELRQTLAEQLPDYMVPSALVPLDALPFNPNGKVDRQALPLPARVAAEDLEIGSRKASASLAEQPFTDREQALVGLWQTLLGEGDWNRQSNFFEQGGDSLSALRLLVQLEQRFGLALTLSDLFQTPTLGALAQRFGSNNAAGDIQALTIQSTVVPLRTAGRKAPFFFVNAMSYGMLLAPHFDADYPFYGINIFGATEALLALPSFSLAALAERCVADLRAVQPQGPYYLAGYCDNSKLAFEIAQCLQRQGDRVAMLAFIDATWENKLHGWRSHWDNLRRLGPTYVSEKLRTKVNGLREKIQIAQEKLRSQLQKHQGSGETQVGRDILLLQRYNQALADYQADVYAGAIDCFLCGEMRLVQIPQVEHIAQGGIRIHAVTGYHHTMFEPPHVACLAQQLVAVAATTEAEAVPLQHQIV